METNLTREIKGFSEKIINFEHEKTAKHFENNQRIFRKHFLASTDVTLTDYKVLEARTKESARNRILVIILQYMHYACCIQAHKRKLERKPC